MQELADTNDTSKAFYKKLHSKHRRESFKTLIEEDGSETTDSQQIMQTCVEYFTKILNAPKDDSIERGQAIEIMLDTVVKSISGSDAQRMDAPFSEEELHFALKKMGADKTPSICGLSKEFLVAFWPQLSSLVMKLLNEIWSQQHMHPSLKQGLIKLLPKHIFCTQLQHWRPITMMGVLYKLLAKSVALKISPHLRKHIHKNQAGFIGGRSILENILSVKLGIELAQKTQQNMVMLQIDYAKAFDTVAWDFIEKVLRKLGFGDEICNCIYLLVEQAQSRIILNGRLSPPVNINRSVRQGCPLYPLFFVVATHPMFTFLEYMASTGKIQGLQLSKEQLLALGFADDTILFLQASNLNIQKCMSYIALFSLAAGLNLNLHKSQLIDINAENFHHLVWAGKRIQQGQIFRHLDYPVGVNVSKSS